MSNKLRDFTLALCFVAALACVVVASQKTRISREGQQKSFESALRESVPPVGIYAEHAIFNRMVRIERVESLKADGRPSRASAVLKAIGSGLVIDAGGRAARIDVDDLLAVGDWIIGGIAENAGDHPVRIIFDGGREMTLQPGEVFYVGTYERLLRPDQIPGAKHAVAKRIETVSARAASHHFVCECQCVGQDQGAIAITVDTTASTDCGNINGTRCSIPGGEDGRTSECRKVALPRTPATKK